MPLRTVRDWLGHANVAQTSTYLANTTAGQHDHMQQFEARRAAVTATLTGGAPAVETTPAATAVGIH